MLISQHPSESVTSKWIFSGGLHSSSPQPPKSTSAASSSRLVSARVHFLWLTVTILVTADSWWAETRLLEYSRSVDPTGVCDADYSRSETGPGAVWIMCLISLRQTPVSLAAMSVKQRVLRLAWPSEGLRFPRDTDWCVQAWMLQFSLFSCLTAKRKCGEMVMKRLRKQLEEKCRLSV